MKINKKTSIFSRKKVIALAVVLLLLASVGGYFYVAQQRSNAGSSPINYKPATKEQADAGDDVKQNAIKRGENSGNNTTPPPEASLITMTATYDKGARQLIVSSKLDNSVSWDKCFLELIQGDKRKSFEARTVYQQDNSFCGGFTVPAQDMSGTWQILLKVSDLSGKIHEENGSVEIQ